MKQTIGWLLVSAFSATALLAQDPRGTIVGQITDTTGAVVPNAKVSATNLATNVTVGTTSNSDGNYELPYLLPGTYRLGAEQTGFERWIRPELEIRMRDRLVVDIQLAVGSVKEAVEVSGQAPLVETATGGLGQVLDTKQAMDLPLRSGSLSWTYSMAPGVLLSRLPYDGPWNIADASVFSVAGGAANSMDFNMDGVSNNSYSGQTSFIPPQEMVQEVRVETQSYDASIGHTTGGSVDVSLKSGTNSLHGSARYEISAGPMQTRNFFTDNLIYDPTTGPITPAKIAFNTPFVRWVRMGAAIGGPVYIPKLYNGRNKTFWEFGYQRHVRTKANGNYLSVPTAAERTGNLSDLLALGSTYQIYDPLTTTPAPNNRLTRQPFPGNIIPASRIDPVSQKVISYFPSQNIAGTANFLQDYQGPHVDTQTLWQPMVRVDHNFSEKNRLFGRFTETDFTGDLDNFVPGNKVTGNRWRLRPSRGAALDDVIVLSPRTLLDVRYGFTWFREYQYYGTQGWNLSEFGWPASFISQLTSAGITFPAISISGLTNLGSDGGFKQTWYSHSLLAVLTRTSGAHSIKAGVDGRRSYATNLTYGNVSPSLSFGSTYTNGPLDNSPAAPAGQGLASFLLGIPTGGGSYVNDINFAQSNLFLGLFIQDDWRVTNKLTLNLGLRWEYEGPPTERYNRSSREFDFSVVNPIQAQAQAQYAANPIAQIPVSQFQTLGGVTFAGNGGNPRGYWNPDYRDLMPRFGFAYRLSSRLVMRGGYGMFFGLRGSEYTNAAQPGFGRLTNVVASLNTGITYVASIENPLPSGLVQPTGSGGGLTTLVGGSPGVFATDGRRSYTQRWSYTTQFQLIPRSVLEIGYIGSKSVHLPVTTDFDAIPRQYLSTSPTRNQAAINLLTGVVPNPFVNIPAFAGTSLYSTQTTSVSQLVLPYPEFTDIAATLPAGSSWFHALSVRFERRLFQGLQAQANYTFSKSMGATNYLNPTDSNLEHVISTLDRPHRVNLSMIYQLPFGSGRHFDMKRLWNEIAGGWDVDVIYNFQSGPPLSFGNVIFTCSSYDQLQMPHQSLQQWFNTSCFQQASSLQLANNIRTFPILINAVRGDGIAILDLSVHKDFPVWEKIKLQLSGTAEGLTNHPNFSPPNTTPTSTLFGSVTATQTGQEERRIFVILKLMF